MPSIKMNFLVFVLPYLFIVSCVGVCDAQSLFERRDLTRMEPFTNYVARARGDLLVVLINENTDVENRDERSLDRQGSSSSNAGLNYGLTGNLGQQQGAGSFGSSSDGARAFTGDSEFRSERQFQDRFTVTVVDVLPNGNMLIEGKRNVVLQGDKRTLQSVRCRSELGCASE